MRGRARARARQFDRPLIALERLNLEGGKGYTRRERYLSSLWPRRRLQQLIEYKATWEGIPVVHVSPARTSIDCYECGQEGQRDGAWFYCPSCGKRMLADDNAARNLCLRALKLVERPPRGENPESPNERKR